MNAAVVTTLNEADSIGSLVTALYEHVKVVIVVDDGSTDQTRPLATHAGARVIPTAHVGIGPALVKGWQAALDYGAQRIVQIDAGGSHSPSEVPRLLAAQAAVVIGSRFGDGGRAIGRPLRVRLSKAAAMGMNLVASDHHTDWTSGYRCFSATAAARLAREPYTSRMHGWQIEVLLAAHRLGLTVAEVPITYRAGRSSFGWPIVSEAGRVWWGALCA